MAVTVTNNLTLVDDADAGSSWNSNASAFSGFEREATAALGEQASEGYHDDWVTVSSTDLSSQTLFGWMRSGAPHTEASNGFGFVLGDGTDRIAYTVGGTDNWGHFVLGWGGFKMDCAIRDTTAGNFRTLSGSEGNLAFNAITNIGYSIGFQAKANGNAENLFWDVLRRIANGSAALTVAGGGSGTEGTWAEIVAEDESTASGRGWGIVRTIISGSKAYELFYGIEFGDSGTATTHFDDSDFQVFIEGSDQTAGNMDIDVLANGTGTNVFRFDNYVIVGIGTRSNIDVSNTNIDTLKLSNGQWTGCGTFSLQADAAGVTLTDIVWIDCLRVNDTGAAAKLNGSSVDLSAVAANEGALFWDANVDTDGNLDDMTFSQGTNAHHAIRFGTSIPASITLRNCDFSGFSASDDADGSVFKFDDTTGSITLNLVGCTHDGSGFTVDDRAGSTVTVVIDPVTTLVHVEDNTGADLENARVLLEASDGTGDFPFEESVSITRSGSTATVTHTAHGLETNDIVVIRDADQQEYNGPFTITVTDANTYTYTVSGTPDSPATGTIISSGAILSGLTDVNGDISASRTFSANTPVKGVVRKSTSTPRFKSFTMTGTIDNTAGLTINVRMILDE